MADDYTKPVSAENSSGGSKEIGLDKEYIKSIPAILKIAEATFSLLGFISAASDLWWIPHGGGFVQFATLAAFVSTSFIFVVFLLRIIYKLPFVNKWPLIEFIYLCGMSLFMLIAFIVSSARTNLNPPGGNTPIIASAVFTCLASIAFVFNALLAFRLWRSS